MFLKEILDLSYEYGIENFLALIFADNPTSLKLFKKFGFKEWGHFPNVAKIHDEDKDLLILGLKVK